MFGSINQYLWNLFYTNIVLGRGKECWGENEPFTKKCRYNDLYPNERNKLDADL